MANLNAPTNKDTWKSLLSSLPVSINDLRDKEFAGVELTEEQLQALYHFDHYRIHFLNSATNEQEFHQRYCELQAKANLSPYEEFLKEEYRI